MDENLQEKYVLFITTAKWSVGVISYFSQVRGIVSRIYSYGFWSYRDVGWPRRCTPFFISFVIFLVLGFVSYAAVLCAICEYCNLTVWWIPGLIYEVRWHLCVRYPFHFIFLRRIGWKICPKVLVRCPKSYLG